MYEHAFAHDWLAYARRLLEDQSHRAACDLVLGPQAVERADAGDLRWPGYLGESFRPGGLLVVQTVHREFSSGRPSLPAAATGRLVAATRAWRDGSVDDAFWLQEMRAVYVAGFDRHWAVGRVLRALSRQIGVEVAEVAYVNAARCQVVENEPQLEGLASRKQAVVRLCASAYPISDLVRLLDPGAIVVTKGTFDVAPVGFASGTPLFVADQRQLCLRAPFRHGSFALPVGTFIRTWAPALREFLDLGRSRSAVPPAAGELSTCGSDLLPR